MPNHDETGWIEDPTRLEKVVDSCKMEQSSDRYMSRFYLQMRYARPTNVTPQNGTLPIVPSFFDGFVSVVKQIGYNTTMEVTDACTARICQKLRPRVEAIAAKPDIVRMCTLLNRLQDGVLDTCDFLAEATQAWEDSYSFPCGFVLFETEPTTGEIRCHRVDPLTCYWHRAEGRQPVHFYMEEAVSRSVLRERYPDFKDEINAAADWAPEHILGVDPPSAMTPDTVRLCRGWRRKVGDEPGRYVVTVGRTVLNGDPTKRKDAGQEWPYDFFPLAVFRNRWDFKGFGGIPVTRYISPYHIAINAMARVAEDSFKGAVPIIWSHKDAGVNDISDLPYQVRKWSGAIRPEVTQSNPVSEQLLKRIDYLEAKAYACAGVNKAMASGQKPVGINSAVGLREVIELADARLAELQKHWEAAWRQAGHIIVALANELKKVKVKAKVNSELMTEIDTSAIKLERADYRISYSLTSALSKTIAGLQEDLAGLKDLGFIDREDMAEAIGDKVPDVQGAIDRVTSPRRLAHYMVQKAIEDGIVLPPGGLQGQDGLDAIVVIGRQAWCTAMLKPDQYKPEKLEALRRLIKAAIAKKGAPIPQQMPIQPGQPMQPGMIVPVGQPSLPGQTIAHNQYEAASLGLLPPQQ